MLATRIDKSDTVNNVVKQLVDSGGCYLRHRKHVYNFATVLPKIKERHQRKHIEINVLENISLKAKDHFSGKQYALHCTTVHPGEVRFE